MIGDLLPLSTKKMEILRYIYENQPVHLRKIAAELNIHPYIVKKCIDTFTSAKIVEPQKAGKTILLSINRLRDGIEQILYVLESYKQKADNAKLKNIIKVLQQQFSRKSEILSCIIFGSYARGAATKESDVDILLIVKEKNTLFNVLSRVSTLLNVEFSPIIMDESEFKTALETKDPATVTLLKPSQHIVVCGIEYFLKTISK